MTYGELCKAIADDLCIPLDTTNLVLKSLIEIMTVELEANGVVKFPNFGTFRVRVLNRKNRVALFKAGFISSLKLRARLEKNMDKLGVAYDEVAVQVAKLTGLCPKCQQPLVAKDPPQCGACGTEPFEQKSSRQNAAKNNFHTLYGHKGTDTGRVSTNDMGLSQVPRSKDDDHTGEEE
jgi:hypothetical protein